MFVSSTNRTGYTPLPSNRIPSYDPSQPYRGEYAPLFSSEDTKPKTSFFKKCLIGAGIVLAGLAACALTLWLSPSQIGERLQQGFSLLKEKGATLIEKAPSFQSIKEAIKTKSSSLLEKFPRVQSAISHFGSTLMGFFKRA